MSNTRRTLVVGGGPAGASAARELRRAGREVTVVEAADGLGGRARSWHRPEIDPDVGINLWFTNTYKVVFELIREHDLMGDLIEMTNNLIIVDDGVLGEIKSDSARTMLAYPHVRLRERLAFTFLALSYWFRRGKLDVFDPEKLAEFDDGTTATQWAERRLGSRVLEKLIRPEIESFWLWSCDDVSQAHVMAMQATVVGAKFYVFKRGMESLVEAMVKGADVRRGCEVVDLTVDDSAVEASWRSTGGELTTERFDDVVVATNAHVANKLTASLPSRVLDQRTRQFLESQRYEPALSVCYVVDRVKMPSAAHIVPAGQGPHPVQTIITFPRQTVADGRDVELAFIYPGRQTTRELLGKPPEHVFERTRELVRTLWPDFPDDAEPFEIAERPLAMPIPEPGRYRTSAEIARRQRAPLVFAGDYFCSPTAEAAIRSGRRAARALLASG